MASGLVVSYVTGTKFDGYSGTIKEAEVAMGVCGNLFSVATEICSRGFVPVAHVSYSFDKREIHIHFTNQESLSHAINLDGGANIFKATRTILQGTLLPALVGSEFVAG